MKKLKELKAIVAAGGTGGHIMPALSIAQILQKSGVKVLFIGNKNSMEEKIITGTDIEFIGINVQKFYRNFTFAHFKFPWKILKSIFDSYRIIHKYKPDFFLGTGGFVSGPVGYAAHLKRIPIFIQEQNSFPGFTSKILGKYAQRIFCGSKKAGDFFQIEKVIISGNPVNQSVASESAEIDYDSYGLDKTSPKVMLLGGSQGSMVMNNIFFQIIDDLLQKNIQIIWQTGKRHLASIKEKIKDRKGIFAFDFTESIGKIYNSIDLVIARAGATSLAEFEIKEIPAILIPLPSAAENHQFYNAQELVNKNVAILIEQKDLTSETLFNKIILCMNNLAYYKSNYKENIHLGANILISKTILEYFHK